MISRGRLFWVGAIVALAGLVLLSPRAEDPDATLALRRYLANSGFEVLASAQLPGPGGTFILVHDLREADQARPVLRWVEQGGTLVVADPRSIFLGMVGGSPGGPIGLAGSVELEPGCLAAQVVGVGRVTARASDVALTADNDEFVSCLPAGDGAFLLTRRYGEGTVTLLGGVSPLTNELLADGDNAVLALQVAGPGPEVVFGPPLPPGAQGGAGAWDLLPDPARVVVIVMMLSAVGFALVRARRLGPPVLEEPVAPIPASELVRATARMYRRAGALAHSGSLLRKAQAARFSRGLWAAARGHELAHLVAGATQLPQQRVEEILFGPDPRTDDELIALGLELEELASRTRQVTR